MKLDLDNLKMIDAHDFLTFQEEYELEFEKFCKSNPYAGADDKLDNDLNYLNKAFEFFYGRGYINQ